MDMSKLLTAAEIDQLIDALDDQEQVDSSRVYSDIILGSFSIPEEQREQYMKDSRAKIEQSEESARLYRYSKIRLQAKLIWLRDQMDIGSIQEFLEKGG